jgi:phage tail sheath protein FI
MTQYRTPGVYIEEVSGGARPIQAVGTRTAGFVGVAPNAEARLNEAVAINNWTEFRNQFFPKDADGAILPGPWTDLAHGVYGFFQNGGSRCYVVNVGAAKARGKPKRGDADNTDQDNPESAPPAADAPLQGNPISGSGGAPAGLDILKRIDEVAIVAAPGYTDADSYAALHAHCEKLKDRVAILDGPVGMTPEVMLALGGEDVKTITINGQEWQRPTEQIDGFTTLYVPWLKVRNPQPNALEQDKLVAVPPSGHVAGIWARSDATRGVHKAPANEMVNGALGLAYQITHEEQGALNPKGINCIRFFVNEGIKGWGARTLAPAASEWRYLNVRRLFNLIEESIQEGTRWIVFEPNDRPLWQAIRRDVSAFLMGFWREGALVGRTPEEAFYVKCDEETNPTESIDAGQVVIEIGLAPVKPAEFVIFRISQYQAGSQVAMSGG